MIEIYITTNLINGKIYIGQCYAGKRWYLGSGVYLKNAVKLYGKENFKREILLIVGNEYANWFETAFIEGYNSVNKNIGYNIAKQASTVRGIHFKHSKKTIEKISKSKLGKTYEEMYGEEVGKKLRKLRADEAIERFTGSKRSEEAKEKMRIKASNRERKKMYLL